jgi:tight adherence protein B
MIAATIVIIFVTTFLIASAAVVLGSILLRPSSVPQVPAGVAPYFEPAETPLLLQQQLLSSISVWRQLLARFDFVENLKVRISEAGLTWSVGRVTLMMLLLGSIGAVIAYALDLAPLITVPLIGGCAAVVPYLLILRTRKRRFRKMEEQFPEALDSLSRALRAGHPFGAGMDLVAGEAPEPLAQEIRKSCDEWQLGLAWNESLENLARRVPLIEIRLFVAAVTLQNRFGGKLNEILEELAKSIRDSVGLRGDVRAASAQGRMTGRVLTILPIAIAAIMWVTSPSYIGVLWQHPEGKYLMAGAAVCLVLGHFCIQRIVNIKA